MCIEITQIWYDTSTLRFKEHLERTKDKQLSEAVRMDNRSKGGEGENLASVKDLSQIKDYLGEPTRQYMLAAQVYVGW